MTDKEYEEYLAETEWGKEMLKENLFDAAIKLLRKTGYKVSIIKSFDANEDGKFQSLIIPAWLEGTNNGEFWLNSFKTNKECKDFCKKIGWKII